MEFLVGGGMMIVQYSIMASTQIVGKATTSTKQKRMCKWVA
jgi:hypothetical protein